LGRGFLGNWAFFSDDHLQGLTKLATGIKREDSLAVVQLHHAGMRSPADLIGQAPVCPSDHEDTGAIGLSVEGVQQLIEDFISGAERAEKAGFDGVEIHGAHGYILAQFLSGTINQRQDQFGGCIENRMRPITEIIEGVRARCRPDFLLGLRLSPERFDVHLPDIIEVARHVLAAGKIDFLDMSLWDSFKEPEDDAFKGRTLLSYFTELERGNIALGVAGKLRNPSEVNQAMAAEIDFVMLGRAAIIHHDFPRQMQHDSSFTPKRTPVSADHLRREGLGEAFVTYMSGWKGFVG
jgi:2,4-dienoyl-CoA reductase-like NADH-dependent reductase (Old Yellow Enzyme family)